MFEQVLEQIAQELDRRKIPYMLIGGQAVLLYGEPRLTRDIDVTLGIAPERHREVLEIAQACGWQVLVEAPARFVEQTFVLPCLEPTNGIRIDFIFSITPYEREALNRISRVPVGKTTVCFASVEDLIIHKLFAGRPRDIEDVRGILLKGRPLDVHYINRWLKELEAGANEPLVRRFEEIRGSIVRKS